MAFALRAVHAIAAAPAFRATARVARRATLVHTRAMADEAAEEAGAATAIQARFRGHKARKAE